MTGNDKVGGLVGSSLDGTITRAYSTGRVTSAGLAGGLVAEQFGAAVTTDSYWNITTSGQATSAGGTGKTSAQMMQAATFAGWDMATQGGSTAVWRIYEGQTGPLLRSFLLPLNLPDTSVVFNGAQQSGAGAAGVTAASGLNPGIYNAWSTQEGYDITGGTLTVRAAGPAPTPSRVDDEAYRSAMVYLAGVGRAANAQAGPGADALAGALSAAAAEAGDEGGR